MGIIWCPWNFSPRQYHNPNCGTPPKMVFHMLRRQSKKAAVPPRNPQRHQLGSNTIERELDDTIQNLQQENGEPRSPGRRAVDSINDMASVSRPPTSGHGFRSRPSYDEIPIMNVDHVIASHGGTTTSIERLPGRMGRSKHASRSLEDELVEAKREIG